MISLTSTNRLAINRHILCLIIRMKEWSPIALAIDESQKAKAF